MTREVIRRIVLPTAGSLFLAASIGISMAAVSHDPVLGMLLFFGAVLLWFGGAFFAGAVIDMGRQPDEKELT